MPGMSATLADACLSNEVDSYTWVQLHVGDPGANGTANVATETDRVQVAWTAPGPGAVANTRGISSTADAVWVGVAGTEDFTHYSVWTLSSGGVFGHSGTITANAVTAGDTFTIPGGDLDVYYPIAA